MNRIFIFAVVAMFSCSNIASADTLAYWNFNNLSIGSAATPGSSEVPASLMATTGAGVFDLGGWTGLVDDLEGAPLNTVGDPAGASLTLLSDSGNGSFVDVNVSLTGFMDPVLSFATRGTGTGFDSGVWSWSTDGTNFTGIAGDTASNADIWVSQVVDLMGVAGLTDAADVTFRYTLSGATTISGENRIDNFQINATTAVAVPEPTSLLVLIGSAVALGCIRRRHHCPG